MGATSSVGLQEKELENYQNQQLQHSPGEGASAVMASSPPADADSQGRKRSHPENPGPDAEVMALSPNTIMATNRFFCEVCNKGFQRESNLQLHRRGHNLPWKLKKKTDHEVRKKVYICPEIGCVHHDPSRALGDLTQIKRHFSRKHGERKFSCRKCNRKYALDSDRKVHDKICGTKEYKCECGTTFSRRDSFISHRSSCDAGKEVARHTPNRSPYSSMAASNPGSMSLGSAAGSLIQGNHHQLSSPLLELGASRPNSFTSLLSGQSVGSAFQPIQPPNMPLHPFLEPKLRFPGASDISGNHGFPSYTAPNNMFSFGFNRGADLNIPQIDLNLNLNNSFSGSMKNADASACHILNSTPAPQLSANALQMPPLAGGMMYNVKNADGMLVGQVNSNVGVEPHMNVGSDHHSDEKHTRDFLGMGIGMNSFTGGGIVDDHSGNEIQTNSSDSEATISDEARPWSFSRCGHGF